MLQRNGCGQIAETQVPPILNFQIEVPNGDNTLHNIKFYPDLSYPVFSVTEYADLVFAYQNETDDFLKQIKKTEMDAYKAFFEQWFAANRASTDGFDELLTAIELRPEYAKTHYSADFYWEINLTLRNAAGQTSFKYISKFVGSESNRDHSYANTECVDFSLFPVGKELPYDEITGLQIGLYSVYVYGTYSSSSGFVDFIRQTVKPLVKHEPTGATCTDPGNDVVYYTCPCCGKAFSNLLPDDTPNVVYIGDDLRVKLAEIDLDDYYTPALGGEHTYESVTLTQATCTEDGLVRYTCTRCGDYYDEVVEAFGHNYYADAVIVPTCTEQGYTRYFCLRCGIEYRDDYTDALGHTYELVDGYDATCTEDGYASYTCTRCGDFYEEFIPASGHSYVEVVTAPTCTEGGYTTHTCSLCGDSYVDAETPALGHNLTVHRGYDATCTEDGATTYWSCSRCGKYYADGEATTEIAADNWAIPATGHSYGEWMITHEPSCTEDGEMTRICSVCGDVQTAYSPAQGHVYDENVWVYTTDGTQRGHLCTVCGQVVDIEDVPVEPGLYGDLNGDGAVNISDVTLLLNVIAGTAEINLPLADLDENGQVTIGDVSKLLNIIAGKA